MSNVEILSREFAAKRGVTLAVSPATIDKARALVRASAAKARVEVSTFLVGDKMIVEVVGGA